MDPPPYRGGDLPPDPDVVVKSCQGYGSSTSAWRRARLQECAYPADGDDVFCTFHRKLVDGLITDIDGRSPSWPPSARRPRAEVSPRTPLERLREEWGLS